MSLGYYSILFDLLRSCSHPPQLFATGRVSSVRLMCNIFYNYFTLFLETTATLTDLTASGVCFCCIPAWLLSTSLQWAGVPRVNAQAAREPSPAHLEPTRPILCRFLRKATAPQLESTCIAEYLATERYQQIASCRGLDQCELSIGGLRPIRLWSPDSVAQFILTSSSASTRFAFPVFTRAAKVKKGPWISAASIRAMHVRWETDQRASSWLRVMNSPATSPQWSKWFAGSSHCPDGDHKRCVNTAIITNLSPNHRYHFVLGDAAPAKTTGLHPSGELTTEPSTIIGTEFSFSVLGDV